MSAWNEFDQNLYLQYYIDEKTAMQTIISVGGRFHAFDLASQLIKHDSLARLITSYPKFEVIKYGIPREKTKSVLLKEILERGWHGLPYLSNLLGNPQYFISETYDKMAASFLTEADIFTGWSSFSLHTLRKARRMGMKIVIDHGSSHIQHQDIILREEYSLHGITPVLAHPKIIEKELKEYEEADYVSIPSLFVKKTFLDKGFPENKLIHVPYGVDLTRFKQIAKNDNIFRVIFAGGMTLRKGVQYILQAMSELNLPNSELMLIGSMNDEMRPFFDKYEGDYKWVGHVRQSELYKYYSQGSVFVMMSVEEGLSLVQPQAMACGLPIIATTNTGAEDVVRDGVDGFIIPIRDIETLKKKIIYLYENKEKREQMAQSAKTRVSRGFTWDDYGENIMTAYKKIIS